MMIINQVLNTDPALTEKQAGCLLRLETTISKLKIKHHRSVAIIITQDYTEGRNTFWAEEPRIGPTPYTP